MSETDKAKRCGNYAINAKQCPCSSTGCARHGICCECVAFHVAKGGKTACMRGAARPMESMSLPVGKNTGCGKRTPNKARCTCGDSSCSRNGLCCDCVRYHWGNQVWPSVGCM